MSRMSLLALALAGVFMAGAASAQVTIDSPTSGEVHHQNSNVVTLSGTASGDVARVTWRCERGCNQSGVASGTASWTTAGDTLYVDGGSNIITVTAEYRDGSVRSDTIDVYRTVPQPTRVSFPYHLDFDAGPQSVYARYTASAEDGARVTHADSGCWKGGCARFVPSYRDNSYAALGGFMLPEDTRRVHVRYLVKFGPDFVDNLDTRMKHLLIHRGTDYSHDRGMVYVWQTNDRTDMSMAACNNTSCLFEAGKERPDGTESFLLRDHLGEWVAVEAVFDTAANVARVYVSTQDGRLRDHLLAEQRIHDVAPELDHWTRISVLGAFIDLGTRPSDGMYWLMDELAMDDDYIGPPPGFGRRASASSPPAAPVLRTAR